MSRLHRVKGMIQVIQSNQSISSNYVDRFWEIFYFVELFFGKRSILFNVFQKKLNAFPFFEKRPISLTFFFFGKRSISLTFLWGYFKSIQLIQSYQSLTTLWKRIDSVTNQPTWKRNWIDSIHFAEKWIDSSQTTQSSWFVYKSAWVSHFWRGAGSPIKNKQILCSSCVLWHRSVPDGDSGETASYCHVN